MSAIALRAGVSRTTVSFVLNGHGEKLLIPEATRQRVLDAAHELNYQPNSLARAVATGHNRVLGFLGHGQPNAAEFQWRLLHGASEEATRRGYVIKILLLDDPQRSARVCLESRLAGLLSVSSGSDGFQVIRGLLGASPTAALPLAVMEDEGPLEHAFHVLTDQRRGLELVLEHLIGLGHERVGYISGSPTQWSAQARRALFCEVATQRGLKVPASFVVDGGWWDPHKNRAAARQLLDLPLRPTAIVCAGDPIALSVLQMASELNVRVPHDVSVTGFADFQMAQFASPPLTSVAQPFESVGALATRRLIQHIELTWEKGSNDIAVDVQQALLEPQLMVRSSTCSPAGHWLPGH